MKENYINSDSQKRDDGICVVATRASKWIEIAYNNRVVASTVSKISQKFWIVNLHKMVQFIVYNAIRA